jgi:hypothetical protein
MHIKRNASSEKKHVGLEKFGKSGSMIRMAGRYDCLLAVLFDGPCKAVPLIPTEGVPAAMVVAKLCLVA